MLSQAAQGGRRKQRPAPDKCTSLGRGERILRKCVWSSSSHVGPESHVVVRTAAPAVPVSQSMSEETIYTYMIFSATNRVLDNQ